MKILIFALLFCISLGVYSQPPRNKFKDGYEAIKAMHMAYSGGKWYKNFTFSQETRFYNKEGKEDKMEVWHEASSSPGKLLIKFNTKDSKNGALFQNGKVHGFKENQPPIERAMIHDLCLAAFDIYFLKPAESTRLLDSLGYNLKLLREDMFNGRKVLVIGAAKNDSTSKQLWIDAERYYLHRIIYKQGKALSDVVLTDYEKMPAPKENGAAENYWVAKKIIFKQNGQLSMIENYFDIKFPKELNKDLFDPAKFNEVKLD